MVMQLISSQAYSLHFVRRTPGPAVRNSQNQVRCFLKSTHHTDGRPEFECLAVADLLQQPVREEALPRELQMQPPASHAIADFS